MTKDELIDKMPGDLKPWAELWLPVLLRWSEIELTNFITGVAGISWIDTYKTIIEAMTPDEKVKELKLRRQEFKRLNNDNAALIKSQRSLFFSIMAQAVMSLTG